MPKNYDLQFNKLIEISEGVNGFVVDPLAIPSEFFIYL